MLVLLNSNFSFAQRLEEKDYFTAMSSTKYLFSWFLLS